jgi:hypothetical protein
MKIRTLFQAPLILLVLYSCSTTPYDTELITDEQGLNFIMSDKRGIRADNGVVYLVDKERLTLTAYNDNKIVWTVSFKETCGTEKPEIKGIELTGDKIQLVFGKRNFATIDIRDGKTKYRCED